MARKAQQSRKARAKRVQARASRKVSRRASPIPKGMHTITPNLVLKDSAQAIEFYGKAFGAKELSRMPSPDGKGIWHAELKIGDSVIYLNDESPQGTCVAPSSEHKATASVHLYVRDSDALFDRAVKAGATVVMPMQDMFWGDRMGMVIDPFGNSWTIATHQRDLTRAQLRKAADEFSQRMAAGNEGTEPPEISPEVVG